jgi:GxxExxY protein
MTKILHADLCYRVTGCCFKVHKNLGRFCREKQFADELEKQLSEHGLDSQREFVIRNLNPDSPEGNRVDFLIEEIVLLDVKAKNFVTKEDYFQMQRYLRAAKLELGLIVNFRESHLKPKRVLNHVLYSDHSDVNS